MEDQSPLHRFSSVQIDLHKFESVVIVEVEVMMEHVVFGYVVVDRSLLVQLNALIQIVEN